MWWVAGGWQPGWPARQRLGRSVGQKPGGQWLVAWQADGQLPRGSAGGRPSGLVGWRPGRAAGLWGKGPADLWDSSLVEQQPGRPAWWGPGGAAGSCLAG
jgi:hypothetical protein